VQRARVHKLETEAADTALQHTAQLTALNAQHSQALTDVEQRLHIAQQQISSLQAAVAASAAAANKQPSKRAGTSSSEWGEVGDGGLPSDVHESLRAMTEQNPHKIFLLESPRSRPSLNAASASSASTTSQSAWSRRLKQLTERLKHAESEVIALSAQLGKCSYHANTTPIDRMRWTVDLM
jgi:hypothetical protein